MVVRSVRVVGLVVTGVLAAIAGATAAVLVVIAEAMTGVQVGMTGVPVVIAEAMTGVPAVTGGPEVTVDRKTGANARLFSIIPKYLRSLFCSQRFYGIGSRCPEGMVACAQPGGHQ